MYQIFQDREEAGKQLAKHLSQYQNTNAIIMAIPRGGVPVAIAMAHQLSLDWNLVVTCKLPVPWNPKAGIGAVAADGSIVLNEQMVHGMGMTRKQIDSVVDKVKSETMRRAIVFSSKKPLMNLTDRCIILVDDGLASGYTMLAAIKSLRAHAVSKVIAAAPVASRSAAVMINNAADECVFEIISQTVPFSVADYYLDWHHITDDDIIQLLNTDASATNQPLLDT